MYRVLKDIGPQWFFRGTVEDMVEAAALARYLAIEDI